jgi:hypothetical protein
MDAKWNLAGTYFEACNCDVACPCVFLSSPTEGECTVLIGWHIDRGNFEDVSLDGLNVAFAIHSPGHMMEVEWKAAIYLDDRATQAQKEALTKIFSGHAGGHPAIMASHVGEILGVKSVTIDYQAQGKRRSLQIPNIAEAEIEAITGQDGTAVSVNNHPLAVAPKHPAVVSKSKQLNYQDYDLAWNISQKNGFFSPFSYQAS